MKNLSLKSALLLLSLFVALWLAAPSVLATEDLHKILDNGPDNKKKVILVAGEGYAKSDKAKWENDVNSIVIQGLLGHDIFGKYKRAFNVYRADIWSQDSGLSQRNGPKRNTAFDFTIDDDNWDWGYFGPWEKDKKTTDRINALDASLPDAALVIILCNDPGWGGVTQSHRWIIETTKIGWQGMQHEMGHGIGHLYDEYDANHRVYKGAPFQELNISTYPDKKTVPWAQWLLPTTKVPTPPWDNPANGIGVYAGGGTIEKGAYHPGRTCRMRHQATEEFCEYCKTLISTMLAPYVPEVPELSFGIKPLTEGEKSALLMPVQTPYTFKLTKSDLLSSVIEPKSKSPFPDQWGYPNHNYIAECYDEKGNTTKIERVSNPFERCYMPRKGGYEEKRYDTDLGTLFFTIPYRNIQDAIKHGIGLRLYQVNPGTQLPQVERTANVSGHGLIASSSEKIAALPPPPLPLKATTLTSVPALIDKSTFEKFKDQNQIKLLCDISPEKISKAAKPANR